jgi:hypothetical protein
MALLVGPLHSDSAAGKFAKSMVFATWKGRSYVRQLVTPANPKSAAQTGIRAMMAWLSKRWTSVSAPDKASWEPIAESRSISEFNAFVSAALERWQANEGPSDDTPPDEVENACDPDAVGDGGVILAAVGAAGYATLTATPDNTAATQAIGCVLYRAAAAPTPQTWAKAIAVFDINPGEEWNYTDSPLDAATYHYKIAYFSNDGYLSILSAADVTAVVT